MIKSLEFLTDIKAVKEAKVKKMNALAEELNAKIKAKAKQK